MAISQKNMLSKLVANRLKSQLDQVFQIVHEGFDVCIFSKDRDVKEVVFELLNQEADSGSCCWIAENCEQANSLRNNQTVDKVFKPIVLLTDSRVTGDGFISYTLPETEDLLPNIAQTVQFILEEARLIRFLDAFDGKRTGALKTILREKGFSALIDAVIQTAYLSGLRGQEAEASRKLSELQALPSATPKQTENVNPGVNAAAFFSGIVDVTKEPHVFLKAALSFYMVKHRQQSISKASRLLNVSRTTLQEHMRLAGEFGVERLFQEAREG